MFKLFMFKTSKGLTITRGVDSDQAKKYLVEICGEIGVELVDFNYCHAAYQYSVNHPFDWLNSAPLWLGRTKLAPSDHSFKNKFKNSALLNVGA